jgi:hypothetical protein
MNHKVWVGGALIIGFGAGLAVWAFRPHAAVDCTTKMNRTIKIAADGTLDCPTAIIGRGNQITWESPAGTTLNVVFPPPSPFQMPTSSGNKWMSGPVHASTFPSGDPCTLKSFAYTITGLPQQINGRIIIEK